MPEENDGVVTQDDQTPVPVADDEQANADEGNFQASEDGTVEPKVTSEEEWQRKLKAAERQAERHRARAEYWQRNYETVYAGSRIPESSQPASGSSQPILTKEPEISDFLNQPERYPDPYAALAKATAQWVVQQQRLEDSAGHQKATKEAARAQFDEDVSERIVDATKLYSNFAEVAGKPYDEGGPNVSDIMLAAMKEGDKFAEIAMYLGQNLDEAERIAALSPPLQVREIGKLEGKLDAGRISVESPKPKPKPVPTINSVGGGSNTTVNLEKISMDDFMKLRNREQFARSNGPDFRKK